MSTFGNSRIVSCEISIPPSGAWHGVARLDATAIPPAVPTQLLIGDLSLIGTPIRGSFEDDFIGGLVGVVLRAGAGRWRDPVETQGRYAAQGSHGSGGVRLRSVLTDLAAFSGETIEQPADVSLGTIYGWEPHTALAPVLYQDILADLVRAAALPTWRVDATGKTRFDPWPSIGPADGRGRVMSRDAERRRRTIGLDTSVAAWLPGATIENEAIRRTVIKEDAGKLIAMVR